MEAMWLSHVDFSRVVNHSWSQVYVGNSAQQLSSCCSVFKTKLQNWNREIFGNLFQKLKETQDHLNLIQNQLANSPTSSFLISKNRELNLNLRTLLKNEELFYAQKARANWLQLGDKNTKFFQTFATIRRKRNHVSKIKDNNGVWICAPLMGNIFVETFRKRFTQFDPLATSNIRDFISIIDPCISSEDNLRLMAHVSKLEIFDVVKSIGALKAPGLDGLHAIFFHQFWAETKHLLCHLVNDFFVNNIPLNPINHTNIALISKIDNPESVDHFRPISLCNVVYKVITKIIITRLRPLLAKCISPNQGAFAHGRSIFDNILIVHELFSDFKRKKGAMGAMALKLDLEKAYDLLDWNYIRACLIRFGFDANWCDRIMNCISTASFSILLNGNPEGFFAPSRCIRQGDPLSPYLFIICMEPFIKHLNKLAESTRTQVGLLSSPHGYRISNLVFADDCLIFVKAMPVAARKVLAILEAFAKASGQRINFHKSTIYFSPRVQSNVKSNISNVLQIQHRTTIGKYLGIHNIIFWKDPQNVRELIDKIRSKFAGWKANTSLELGN
ncbi:unnamed protein product [Prunus brigantina]